LWEKDTGGWRGHLHLRTTGMAVRGSQRHETTGSGCDWLAALGEL